MYDPKIYIHGRVVYQFQDCRGGRTICEQKVRYEHGRIVVEVNRLCLISQRALNFHQRSEFSPAQCTVTIHAFVRSCLTNSTNAVSSDPESIIENHRGRE